jgi:hypothetical protein
MDQMFDQIRNFLIAAIAVLSCLTLPSIILGIAAGKEMVQLFRDLFSRK